MKFRGLLIPCAMLLAGTVAAQSAAPQSVSRDDRWDAAPPAASSTSYRSASTLPGNHAHGVFRFKQAKHQGPAYAPPPQANDKAAVMGKPRPWQNGRPPLDCAAQPRDPACR